MLLHKVPEPDDRATAVPCSSPRGVPRTLPAAYEQLQRMLEKAVENCRLCFVDGVYYAGKARQCSGRSWKEAANPKNEDKLIFFEPLPSPSVRWYPITMS
jgi:hypothetical protein